MHEPRLLARLLGSTLETPWSSSSVIKELIHSVVVSGQQFHGVRVETARCLQFEVPASKSLCWVLDADDHLILRVDFQHLPMFTHMQQPLILKEIISHYDLDNVVYYGVLWFDYPAPTWEAEGNLEQFPDELANYYSKIMPSKTRSNYTGSLVRERATCPDLLESEQSEI